MDRALYSFEKELRGRLLEAVLKAGLGEVAQLGLICSRNEYPIQGADLLGMLQPAFIKSEEVSRWPGAQLEDGSTVRRQLYRYDEPVKDVLLFGPDSLLDWHNPELPDDPHFLRADGSTWLGSLTVDEVAWLELSEGELLELRMHAPHVAASIESGRLQTPAHWPPEAGGKPSN